MIIAYKLAIQLLAIVVPSTNGINELMRSNDLVDVRSQLDLRASFQLTPSFVVDDETGNGRETDVGFDDDVELTFPFGLLLFVGLCRGR